MQIRSLRTALVSHRNHSLAQKPVADSCNTLSTHWMLLVNLYTSMPRLKLSVIPCATTTFPASLTNSYVHHCSLICGLTMVMQNEKDGDVENGGIW